MKTVPRVATPVHSATRKSFEGLSSKEDTPGKGSQSPQSQKGGEPLKSKKIRFNWFENPEGLSLVIQHVHNNEGRKILRLIRECFEEGMRFGYWGEDDFDSVNNKYSNMCKMLDRSLTSSAEDEAQ